MNRTKLLLLIIIVVCLCIGITMLTWLALVFEGIDDTPKAVQRIPITYKIESEKVLGFSYASTSFDMGSIPSGGIARKAFNVSHKFEEPMWVLLRVEGEAAAHAAVYPDRARVLPNEILEAVFEVQPTGDGDNRTRTGELVIAFYS